MNLTSLVTSIENEYYKFENLSNYNLLEIIQFLKKVEDYYLNKISESDDGNESITEFNRINNASNIIKKIYKKKSIIVEKEKKYEYLYIIFSFIITIIIILLNTEIFLHKNF